MSRLSLSQQNGLEVLAYLCVAQTFCDMLNPAFRGPNWSWDKLQGTAYTKAKIALSMGSAVVRIKNSADRPEVQSYLKWKCEVISKEVLSRSGIVP